ncbi:hypothetical protein TrLO_g7412 [Triparma laevis f. longispina]|uniref:Uncharacterized protein n=1 Tax=Triparma laevis f. longispina TaxID=1714387 RepID=A0A9W7F3Z3_9STRA|nr:hypothetical protein TrLO_g7412 [Triparma laevis f. longispina]
MGFGGRIDDTCPLCDSDPDLSDSCVFGEKTCICTRLGEYCYNQYPYYAYDVFLVVTFLMQGINLVYSGWFAFEILKKKVLGICPCVTWCCPGWCCIPEVVGSTSTRNLMKTQKRFSAMESIIILTFAGVLVRCIWLCTIINGRNASVILVDQYTEGVLLKTPQILWMSAYLYTALVWRRISDKCTNLTRNTQAKKSYEKLAFKVNGMAFFLLIVILPLYIYGNMKYPPLVAYVDYCLMLCVITVSIAGRNFGKQLILQLNSSILGGEIIPTINYVLRCSVSAAWLVIITGLLYNIFFRGEGKWFALGFSFIVHDICEFLLCHALLKTKMDSKSKKKQDNAHSMKLTGINVQGSKRGMNGRQPSSMRFSEMFEARSSAAASVAGRGGGLQKERRPSKRDLSDQKMKRLEQHFHKPKIVRTNQAVI